MRERQVENYLADWPGFRCTLISSGKPSELKVLSDTLETGAVPQRYYLSAKACAGILRRAEKRGKKLPEQLQAALEEVATTMKNA